VKKSIGCGRFRTLIDLSFCYSKSIWEDNNWTSSEINSSRWERRDGVVVRSDEVETFSFFLVGEGFMGEGFGEVVLLFVALRGDEGCI
jgi:hypothetical protein